MCSGVILIKMTQTVMVSEYENWNSQYGKLEKYEAYETEKNRALQQ